MVKALKIKYGQPETFSQHLYHFSTTAKIHTNENSIEFGERICHLISQTTESLRDEPKIWEMNAATFLDHLGKIFS